MTNEELTCINENISFKSINSELIITSNYLSNTKYGIIPFPGKTNMSNQSIMDLIDNL